jgi:hypothetical protein
VLRTLCLHGYHGTMPSWRLVDPFSRANRSTSYRVFWRALATYQRLQNRAESRDCDYPERVGNQAAKMSAAGS